MAMMPHAGMNASAQDALACRWEQVPDTYQDQGGAFDDRHQGDASSASLSMLRRRDLHNQQEALLMQSLQHKFLVASCCQEHMHNAMTDAALHWSDICSLPKRIRPMPSAGSIPVC